MRRSGIRSSARVRASGPPMSGEGLTRSPRLPSCPPHLSPAAAAEWRRLAKALQRAGVLTRFDRAALAAYCQAYGRWVEAEEQLRETPTLYKTPSGHVQQSPWLSIANKQLELMGRYMTELGLTPAARSRVFSTAMRPMEEEPVHIEIISVAPGEDGGPPVKEYAGYMTSEGWFPARCLENKPQ
jgi:P27 family predicted phage terminase small subunit